MTAEGHGIKGKSGRMLVGLLCFVVFSGCDSRPSAPETRASYFVEKFIAVPRNDDDLRGITALNANESPEILVRDLQTRTAISYLRARERLGAEFGFHVDGSTRLANGNKLVNVVVSEGTASITKDPGIHFQVELHNQDKDWVVVQLQSD